MHQCGFCNAPLGKQHATNCPKTGIFTNGGSNGVVSGTATENFPHLATYGIQNEQSDIRAHVGVLAGTVYVYRTKDGLRSIELFGGDAKLAYQPGVTYATAKGYPVPWQSIPRIIAIPCKKLIEKMEFQIAESTSDKGRKASLVVEQLIRFGHFPLPVEPIEIQSTHIQRKGIDLIVAGEWRIQVKCDYRAGDGEGCTGNLYLQTAELNPFGYG